MRYAKVFLLSLVLLCGAAQAQYADNANAAYTSFLSLFWVGSQTGGHFATINGNTLGTANVPRLETEPQKGWLWQFAEAWNVPYTYWKVTGSSDALARLGAEWAWVKVHWSVSDLAICNNVGGQSATTLDDADWSLRGLVELYEATGDTVALTYAKAMFDCVNNPSNGFLDSTLGAASHWYDGTPISGVSWSGGQATLTFSRAAALTPGVGQIVSVSGMTPLAYNGTYTALTGSNATTLVYALPSNPGAMTVAGFYHNDGKGFNSLNYALAEIEYYLKACPVEGGACPTSLGYYTAAKTELDWANSTLERSQNSNCPQTDHLYWASVMYGTPPVPTDPNGLLCSRASQIAQAASVVALFADMGGAAANVLVAQQGGGASYTLQATNTAASILVLENSPCGAFLDDRDARGNGFAGYDYAANVLPLLGAGAAAQQAAFRATSQVQRALNRGLDGSYGGDWCGPWNGVWTTAGFNPDQLEISAQAVVLTIIASLYGN